MSEMERGPKYEYSKEEFLAFLKEYTIWRRNFDDSPKRKQVAELSEEEEDIIYSLYRTKTLEESCEILKPLYQKYRADLKNADMPDLILRSIYFQRVMLYPAFFRIVLCILPLRNIDDLLILVKNHRTRTGRALIQCDNIFFH